MMNNRILMRIDFQNDFVHPQGALSLNAPELIARQQKFADNLFPSYFDKIIDTYDTHFAETYGDTVEAQSFPPHCLFGSDGWQQAAPFKPTLEVVKMYKSTTDIWNEAHAYRDLEESWQGKEVYLCGVLSDICVLQTRTRKTNNMPARSRDAVWRSCSSGGSGKAAGKKSNAGENWNIC